MTENQNGIYLHATATGKLHLVARKDDQSISFTLDLEQAETLRDEYQATLSEIQPASGGRKYSTELQE